MKYKRVLFFIFIIFVIFSAALALISATQSENTAQGPADGANNGSSEQKVADEGKFKAPLSDYLSRITKKDFGTYVEPGNSPVDPEVFRGFHSALDLEIFPGEETIEVPFTAICDGKLAIKRMAQGYGGVVAQYCVYKNSPVTVIYGHVVLSSVPFNIGDEIKTGDKIGILGQPGKDTDNERKHLHLGVRKGYTGIILGYVQYQSSLKDYFDPKEILVQ